MDAPTGTPAPVTPPNGGGSSEGTKEQVRNYVDQFETWLDEYMVKKAPFQIPMGGKEFLATIAPYLVIIGAVLLVLALPALLGLGAIGGAMGMMMGSGWGFFMLVSLITNVIVIILELYALSGLFKRTKASWRLIYYATLVSFAGNVLSLNIIGAIVGGIIGWYILFQMKEMYKN